MTKPLTVDVPDQVYIAIVGVQEQDPGTGCRLSRTPPVAVVSNIEKRTTGTAVAAKKT